MIAGIPRGYLVPLRDDSQPVASFVFAFTRWLQEAEVFEYLPAVSNFAGHDIPFHIDEVARLELSQEKISRLPDSKCS